MRSYSLPLLGAAVTLPVALYALVASLGWIGRPFPGFFVLGNRAISTVTAYRSAAASADVLLAQVVAVNGEPVRSQAEVYDRVSAQPDGSLIGYTLVKHGRRFTRTLPSHTFTVLDYVQTCGLLFLFGTVSASMALLVGFLQPHTTQARVYLVSGLVAGLYPITGTLLYRPSTPSWLAVAYLAFESLFPATWIHLALVFPIAHRFTGLKCLIPIVPYLLGLGLAGWAFAGFYGEPPDFSPWSAIWVYTAVAILFFDATMLVQYRRWRDPGIRRRIRSVLFGLVAATTLPLVAFASHAVTGGGLPLQFALVFAPVFYASVAYSIAKHDLFDVDRLVRESVVYSVLSLVLLGLYALVLFVTARVVPALESADGTLLVTAAFVVLVAIALDPLRRVVQRVVDRAFYRQRLDARRTIGELSEIMTALLEQHEIVDQVTRVVCDALQLESAAAALFGADGVGGAWWQRRRGEPLHRADMDPRLPALATAWRRAPQPLRVPAAGADAPSGADEYGLVACGVHLALPLVFRGEPIGLLGLGPRRSGRPLSREDVDVLRTLANQTAIAMHNARSYHALEELTRDLDQKVHEQTRQLRASHDDLRRAYDDLKEAEGQLIHVEKMASLGRLVAGVAHELNNPVSFVHGALANLQDYLTRLTVMMRVYEGITIPDEAATRRVEQARVEAQVDYVLRETPELLRICTEGADRIKHIVDDLRVFARADRGGRTLVNLDEGLDSTIRLLGHRLGGDITVRTAVQEGIRLEANPAQLNQVWMNLLSNAIDAVEGCTYPEICVTAECVGRHPDDTSGGTVVVEIRDNGTGMEPEVLARVFEPFFTTKPSGRGTGLGLSLAYGTVKSHGGTIDVRSTPGVGTVVTVRLPRGRRFAGAPTAEDPTT